MQERRAHAGDATSRDVLAIGIAMIVSNDAVPLACTAAVALGSTVFSMLFWAFGFLGTGTAGLTAQALATF